MAGKAKPLRGRSEFIRPDGTVVPVRDFDGNLVIAPGEWEQIKQQIAKNLSRTVSEIVTAHSVSEIVTAHPERKAAYGIPEGKNSATVCLIDILGNKKAPDGAGTTDECKE